MSNVFQEMQQTIEQMVVTGKGILAADESLGTIGKRFDSIQTENSADNREQYRALLATTPSLNQYINGVILFEETLDNKAEGNQSIPEFLAANQIVPGIKVDKGLVELPNTDGEKVTQGLDGLADRLETYKAKGARFAKWRCVYNIQPPKAPSIPAMTANAEVLARYAAICQSKGIVPIVEPEVLMDGNHSIEDCEAASEQVYRYVFNALAAHRVSLEHMILKPNMILPGSKSAKASPEAVATATVRVLSRTVPAAVPSINFLSGGQSSVEATENLNAMNAMGAHPWLLSFSYGRALQEHCLKAWGGKTENIPAAKAALFERAKLNGQAVAGEYQKQMEPVAV